MKLYQLILPGIVTILGGCAVSPTVDPPPLAYRIPDSFAIDAELVSPYAYLSHFHDSGLASYVQRVLERNNDLRVALNNLKVAKQEAIINGAARLPSLSAGFTPSRSRVNSKQSNGSVVSSTSNNYNLGLNFSWEIDVWGKVYNTTLAAGAAYEQQEELYRSARLSLACNAAKTYYQAVRAHKLMVLAQQTLESYRRTADIIQSRYNSGVSDALDLRLALANADSAEASLQTATINFQSALRACEVLAGEYPAAAFEHAEAFPDLSESIPALLPSELLTRRPDILAAERAFAASHQRALRARKDLLPAFSLTSSVGTSSNELEDLLKSDFLVWNLIGNVTQPIFQGGQLKAQSEIAKLNEDSAAVSYAQTVLEAFSEVEQTLASETLLQKSRNAAALAAGQNEASERLAWEQYASGISEIITVLETQRRNLSAQTALIDADYSCVANRLDLYLALGGSYDSPEDSNSSL